MEFLLFIVALLVGLAVHVDTGLEMGVDCRFNLDVLDLDGPPWPPRGAH